MHTVADLKHLCNAKYANTTCPLFALWPIHRALVVKSCSTSVPTIQGGHISVNVTCSNKWIFSDMSSKETRKCGNCPWPKERPGHLEACHSSRVIMSHPDYNELHWTGTLLERKCESCSHSKVAHVTKQCNCSIQQCHADASPIYSALCCISLSQKETWSLQNTYVHVPCILNSETWCQTCCSIPEYRADKRETGLGTEHLQWLL